jgi:prevent-host-death family protein
MKISVSDAKGQLTELVKKAEAGEEVILTRRGHSVARLVPSAPAANPGARRVLMESVRAAAAGKKLSGSEAARSQDFLYNDDDGMPA